MRLLILVIANTKNARSVKYTQNHQFSLENWWQCDIKTARIAYLDFYLLAWLAPCESCCACPVLEFTTKHCFTGFLLFD